MLPLPSKEESVRAGKICFRTRNEGPNRANSGGKHKTTKRMVIRSALLKDSRKDGCGGGDGREEGFMG